jgi:hypothetical protein
VYDTSLHLTTRLKYHNAQIQQLAFSPDGKELASTSWSHIAGKTITLRDINPNHMVGLPLSGHKAEISGLVFGNEGKTMFSADEDGVIFRWDLDVGSWQTLAASTAGRGFSKDEVTEYLGEASSQQPSDAMTLLKRADVAALEQGSDDTKGFFVEAVKAAITSKDPGVNNSVCWLGSVDRLAAVVLPAGARAIELADEEHKAYYRDTRGLARAIAGYKKEAIEDFPAFIDWADNHKLYSDKISKRKEWIKQLEDNQDPFSDSVLLELRSETMAPD